MIVLNISTIAIVSAVALAQLTGVPTVTNFWQFLGLALVIGLQAWSLWLNRQNKTAIGEIKTQTDGLTTKLITAAGKQGAADVREEIRIENRQDAKDARAASGEIPIRGPGERLNEIRGES